MIKMNEKEMQDLFEIINKNYLDMLNSVGNYCKLNGSKNDKRK